MKGYVWQCMDGLFKTRFVCRSRPTLRCYNSSTWTVWTSENLWRNTRLWRPWGWRERQYSSRLSPMKRYVTSVGWHFTSWLCTVWYCDDVRIKCNTYEVLHLWIIQEIIEWASPFISAPLLSVLLCYLCSSVICAPLLFVLLCYLCSSFICAPLLFVLLCYLCSSVICAPLLFVLLCYLCSSVICVPLLSVLLCYLCSSVICAPLLFVLLCYLCCSVICAPLFFVFLFYLCSSVICAPLLFALLCYLCSSVICAPLLFVFLCYLCSSVICALPLFVLLCRLTVLVCRLQWYSFMFMSHTYVLPTAYNDQHDLVHTSWLSQTVQNVCYWFSWCLAWIQTIYTYASYIGCLLQVIFTNISSPNMQMLTSKQFNFLPHRWDGKRLFVCSISSWKALWVIPLCLLAWSPMLDHSHQATAKSWLLIGWLAVTKKPFPYQTTMSLCGTLWMLIRYVCVAGVHLCMQ